MISSSSCRIASGSTSSTSSITSQADSASGARSISSRSTIAHPSRSGAAVRGWTSADPGAVWRSAPTAASQNRCGSRSPGPADIHAARSPSPASAIQDRSSTASRRRRHHGHPGRAAQAWAGNYSARTRTSGTRGRRVRFPARSRTNDHATTSQVRTLVIGRARSRLLRMRAPLPRWPGRPCTGDDDYPIMFHVYSLH